MMATLTAPAAIITIVLDSCLLHSRAACPSTEGGAGKTNRNRGKQSIAATAAIFLGSAALSFHFDFDDVNLNSGSAQ